MGRLLLPLLQTFLILVFISKTTANFLSNIEISDPEIRILNLKIPLSECKIKVEKDILYACKEGAYVFSTNMILSKTSELLLETKQHIDADIDSTNVVILSPGILTLKFGGNLKRQGRVPDDTLILSRIKTSNHIISLIIISEPKVLDSYSSEPDYSITSFKNQYIIRSFLFAGASHLHNIVFPNDKLDFQLSNDSFKETYIFNDPIFGHTYGVIALEQGWISIFRSLFEDPKLELIFMEKMKEEYEIQAMTGSDNLIFITFEKKKEKKLVLEIYSLQVPNEFKFQKECEINLNEFYNDAGSPLLRVKEMQHLFIIMINFPGDHILTTSFKKPKIGIFQLECPSNFSQLNYGKANPEFSIGYSFDYVIDQPNQGFLLSSLKEGSILSYFIPFCPPNHKMETDKKCSPCVTGYSQGGLSTTCQPCSDKVQDEKHAISQSKYSISNTCPLVCKEENTFGINCNECEEYLNEVDAKVPEGGYAVINSQGDCSFNCSFGYPHENSGTCLKTSQLLEIVHDHCVQINDCMNCTFTQSCSWCDGSCKKVELCPRRNSLKTDLVNDYFRVANMCNMSQLCGSTRKNELSGNITFETSSVYKNQFCAWDLGQTLRTSKQITLQIHFENFTNGALENPPNFFVDYCENVLFRKVCHYVQISGKDERIRKFTASHVKFYVWVEESLIENAQNFRLEYSIQSYSMVLEDVFKFIMILSRFLFICILFTCVITSLQKYALRNRRRRILRELQGIELFRLVENFEEIPQSINVEEVMENNQIVSRVIYEANVNEFEQTECPICLEGFQNEEVLAKLACKHLFHINCFHDWVRAVNVYQQIKCPVCNRILA